MATIKLKIIAVIFSFLGLFLISENTIFAVSVSSNPPIDQVTENTPSVTLNYSDLEPNQEYFIFEGTSSIRFTADSSRQHSVIVCGNGSRFNGQEIKYDNCSANDYFAAKTYNFKLTKPNSRGESFATTTMIVPHFIPDIKYGGPDKPKPGDSFEIQTCSTRRPESNTGRNTIDIDVTSFGAIKPADPPDAVVRSNLACAVQTVGPFETGNYTINVRYNDDSYLLAQFILNVTQDGGTITLILDPKKNGGQLGQNPCTVGPGGECRTGLGDIPTSASGFASKILSLAIGIAGGIALILMVIGSIRVLTSSGDQQKLSGGRDQIVAAIAGLLFLIFSSLILRFIGLSIFGFA